MSEILKNNENINDGNTNDDWLKNEANGGAPVPEFRGKNNGANTEKQKSAIDILNEIDISTEQGKFEWLDSLVSNANATLERERYDMIDEVGFSSDASKEEIEDFFEQDAAYQDNKRRSDIVRRQSKILENLDFDGEGGVLGAIERKRNAFAKVTNNPNASQHAQEVARQNQNAASDLYMILADEIAKRNHVYVPNQESLKENYCLQKRELEKSKLQNSINKYREEIGNITNSSTLSEAGKEQKINNIKSEIEDANYRLDDMELESDILKDAIMRKGEGQTTSEVLQRDIATTERSIEYYKGLMDSANSEAAKNGFRRNYKEAKNKLKRINAIIFDLGKAETSTDAPTPEAQQEKTPTSYYISGGLLDKDVTITVGQEIPDEWFEPKTYGEGALKIVRPPQIEDYLSQALNTEFGKLPEDERRQYNYSALSEVIKAEAKRTKRVPDIINIMNSML